MQHCQTSRLDLSPHCFRHFLKLIILFDLYIRQGPIKFLEVPMSGDIHSLDVSKRSNSWVWEELRFEDGDDSRQSCLIHTWIFLRLDLFFEL